MESTACPWVSFDVVFASTLPRGTRDGQGEARTGVTGHLSHPPNSRLNVVLVRPIQHTYSGASSLFPTLRFVWCFAGVVEIMSRTPLHLYIGCVTTTSQLQGGCHGISCAARSRATVPESAQPVPKAVYRSNCSRCDSNLDPLTSQTDTLTTRPPPRPASLQQADVTEFGPYL